MRFKPLLAAGLLFSATAMGGFTQPAPVTVTINPDGSGNAIGDQVTARFAPDDVTMIGCGVRKTANGLGGYNESGFCQARDSAGTQFTCFTTDPGIIDAMDSIADFSFITFAWNAAGECFHIGNSTQSFYIPDLLDKTKKAK